MMKDEFFIDSVDIEWCWREKFKFNKEIVIDENVTLPHMIGKGETRHLGVRFNMGSSLRYYYVYRNWLLLQKYKYIPLKRRLRILFFIPIRLVVYPIISEDRFSLTKYSLEGLRDGILGRSGPYK